MLALVPLAAINVYGSYQEEMKDKTRKRERRLAECWGKRRVEGGEKGQIPLTPVPGAT